MIGEPVGRRMNGGMTNGGMMNRGTITREMQDGWIGMREGWACNRAMNGKGADKKIPLVLN
jgi:hypothetical protein